MTMEFDALYQLIIAGNYNLQEVEDRLDRLSLNTLQKQRLSYWSELKQDVHLLKVILKRRLYDTGYMGNYGAGGSTIFNILHSKRYKNLEYFKIVAYYTRYEYMDHTERLCIWGLAVSACIENKIKYSMDFLMFVTAITRVDCLHSYIKYALERDYDVAYLLVTLNTSYLSIMPQITLFDMINNRLRIQEYMHQFQYWNLSFLNLSS